MQLSRTISDTIKLHGDKYSFHIISLNGLDKNGNDNINFFILKNNDYFKEYYDTWYIYNIIFNFLKGKINLYNCKKNLLTLYKIFFDENIIDKVYEMFFNALENGFFRNTKEEPLSNLIKENNQNQTNNNNYIEINEAKEKSKKIAIDVLKELNFDFEDDINTQDYILLIEKKINENF